MEDFFQLAIELAKQSVPEEGKVNPYVGAVLVSPQGDIIAQAFRGEKKPGEHAEYTLFEKNIPDQVVSGFTLYVTLEPCTKRGKEKIPCADRIIERKIKKVYIGILDPNPQIQGHGYNKLRSAGIDVQFFPAKYADQIDDLNRNFKRQQQLRTLNVEQFDQERLTRLKKLSLNQWYEELNKIYWNRNYNKDVFSIYGHLVEVIGGLSLLASSKHKEGVNPDSFVSKAIAWWLALCGKVGIKSVEAMLWDKFPAICPYCQSAIHNPSVCSERKAQNPELNWDALRQSGEGKDRPKTLGEWQKMFSTIYPAQDTEDYGQSFARLTEELGELSEALRVFPSVPGYFLSEASDVFAWLMHVQNILEQKKRIPSALRGNDLDIQFAKAYPEVCTDCNKPVCTCPPILPKTIGRIAHEVPSNRGTFDNYGHFMTVDKTSKRFGTTEE